MRKIHARLSVEIEVSDKEFEKIVGWAKGKNGYIHDLVIPDFLIARAKPCDWDDGGYIPGPWLEESIKYPEGFPGDNDNEGDDKDE